MFAKIMIGNEVYISPVMALTLSGWNSKAVVLNADSSKLIVIDLYRSNSSNQFLLIDYNHDNFVRSARHVIKIFHIAYDFFCIQN